MAGRTPRSFHPRTRDARRRGEALGLREAIAMAVGGMIGGGIFSVLGVTIDLAGHLAWLTFAIGGVIAMLTARSYAGLALRSGRSGGPFSYLRDEGHPDAAAWIAWGLVLGYVFALAVYAFTFGHYLAHVLGAPESAARAAALAALAALALVNLRGVGTSGLTEDLVVVAKLAILGVIAAVGLAHFSPGRLDPPADMGVAGVLIAVGVVFVAYEGFELLSYDYTDLERPRRTLPLALYASVAIVATVYVAVTLGSQMLLSDARLAAGKEVAFAVVGQKALGTAGLWAASLGAVLSTASAINATLFATARLVHTVSDADEMPARLGRQRRGVPAEAIIWLAVAGGVASLVPGITELVAFGSLAFLTVFALVNLMHARHTARSALDRGLALAGAAACALAAVLLLIELARSDRAALGLTVACSAGLVAARIVYVRRRGPSAASPAAGSR